MISRSPVSRIRIGNLVSLSSVVLLVVATASVLLLLGMIRVQEDAMEVVMRDTRSADIADDIAYSALMYHRLSNLWHATREPAVEATRAEVAARLQVLLARLPEHEGGPRELELIDAVAAALPRYLVERQALDDSGRRLSEVIRESSQVLNDLLGVLAQLREMNDAQVAAALVAASGTNQSAVYLGTAALVLLILGACVPSVAAQRYLVRPILELHHAMAAFRQGDLGARGRQIGAWEVGELARMFNDMAATQQQQRRAQIEFLGGVAHDLKNPMSTLKNGIYLLSQEPSEAQRTRTRAMLDAQLALLVRMVDDFLDGARIEAGELELRCIEFDVRHLVRDLVEAYCGIVPSRHLVLDQAPEPLVVSADPLRLEQVLRNLLSNAIKYSSAGDITVRSTIAAEEVVIEVQDQGSGIPVQEQETIFLPFRRRHTNAVPGVGLGLSVVRRIVQAHGGRIELDSEEGVGSTFRVCLPRIAPG